MQLTNSFKQNSKVMFSTAVSDSKVIENRSNRFIIDVY